MSEFVSQKFQQQQQQKASGKQNWSVAQAPHQQHDSIQRQQFLWECATRLPSTAPVCSSPHRSLSLLVSSYTNLSCFFFFFVAFVFLVFFSCHLPVRCTFRRSVQICLRLVCAVLLISFGPSSRFFLHWPSRLPTRCTANKYMFYCYCCCCCCANNAWLYNANKICNKHLFNKSASTRKPQNVASYPFASCSFVVCSLHFLHSISFAVPNQVFLHFLFVLLLLLCYMVNCLSALLLHYGCLYNVGNTGKAYFSQRSALFFIR